MPLIADILSSAWELLRESSVYILFGIVVAGLLRAFLNPATVARHLGGGGATPVLKAALIGVPIPLCSCGVVPAAASLKRQGAGNGATASFLISTPESGVDSIAITYALLDPVMAVARPAAAFLTAAAAGLAENVFTSRRSDKPLEAPDLSCPVDGCCDGIHCDPAVHRKHHTLREKTGSGMAFAFRELWPDLAPWFVGGMLLAGVIQALLPAEALQAHLGGGLLSMLIMLAAGIPLYICATASTPIAAALILKGVSPGAALVFLLAGPATNAASLSMLFQVLGKRATAVYLGSIAVVSVLLGLSLDAVYGALGVSAQAVAGEAAELVPAWAQISGAVVILVLSARPVLSASSALIRRLTGRRAPSHHHGCGCESGSCETPEADDPAPMKDRSLF
jgi:hypothetical protein